MQKLALTTPDFLPSLKHPAKDLERRWNTQSGWTNHPFHRSTSSHGRRYQTPEVSLNQPREGQSHSRIPIAHHVQTHNTLERCHPRQSLPTCHYIISKPKRSASIECVYRRRMGDRKRGSRFGAIYGNPERPHLGTVRRRLGSEFGAGVRKSDSPKDHCGI